jgi:hypothetical protein
MIAADDANVFDNEAHQHMCDEIYGVDYMKEIYRLINKLEPNRVLLKVLLIILAFSTNCSIVTYDRSIKLINLSAIDSFYLRGIQDIFVTMLWKYLVYQYGYEGAVRHFDHIVKNYLDTLNRSHANVSTEHWEMVDIIVEKTTHSLVLDN